MNQEDIVDLILAIISLPILILIVMGVHYWWMYVLSGGNPTKEDIIPAIIPTILSFAIPLWMGKRRGRS